MSELQELLAEAAALSPRDRVQWLVELGDELPEAQDGDGWVEVRECQSPVQVRVGRTDEHAAVAVRVPRTAPLVRGVAALIVLGLDGSPVAELPAAPADLVDALDLGAEVSPLRVNGLRGLWRAVRTGLESP